MYPLAVIGSNATARAAVSACRKAGFDQITWCAAAAEDTALDACILPANVSRIVTALDGTAALNDLAHHPDRQQIRLARSGFLVSELPLGNFTRERYGAPHVNVEAADWPQLLPLTEEPQHPQAEMPLAAIEQQHDAVLVCSAAALAPAAASHQLWHAQLPYDAALARANITWLGQHSRAWQFSTRTANHVYFCTPLDQTLDAGHWHPMLHEAVRAAQPSRSFAAAQPAIREHWHAGGVAYLGDACCRIPEVLPEAAALGLEDAWVLSRMLENYEEDIHDGLQEYQKYRRPRVRRVAAAAARIAQEMTSANVFSRLLRHLNTALSTRFLPEVAMQRIDWFYGYDCLRGFR